MSLKQQRTRSVAFAQSAPLRLRSPCIFNRSYSAVTACASRGPAVRTALELQYDGTDFHGWQAQTSGDVRTVQATVEGALAEVYGTQVRVHAASRTDAGAHALRQVVHFDAPFALSSPGSLTRALNRRLPPSVLANRAAPTSSLFDARRHAAGRAYRYTLHDGRRSVFAARHAWQVCALDERAMDAAACTLVGDGQSRDLGALRRTRAQATHTRIKVRSARVVRSAGFVHIDVRADWFVYGMMRLLAGSLARVGRGEWTVADFQHAIESGERYNVVSGAPAHGLCLVRVEYAPKDDPFGKQDEEGSDEELDIVHPWYGERRKLLLQRGDEGV